LNLLLDIQSVPGSPVTPPRNGRRGEFTREGSVRSDCEHTFVPWKPSYTKDEADEAIAVSATWSDALIRLGLSPYGKNHQTIRKWAARWGITADHLPPYHPRGAPRFNEAEVRAAIAASRSWSEALRKLDYCPTGANPRTLKAWAQKWGILTDHFDTHAASIAGLRRAHQRRPLAEILVENSTFSRNHLKGRLYQEGLKRPICELCGQGEIWRGRRMGLILDHVNGIRNDNRIENLRIVCPNCAATLSTHCGRKLTLIPKVRRCARCGQEFAPKYRDHRYCSRECGSRWDRRAAARRGRGQLCRPAPDRRKVERPPYDQLLREIEETSFLAVGRSYGVSDNAVRKWLRFYERQAARETDEASAEGDLAEAA
jgi:hypothetical protein